MYLDLIESISFNQGEGHETISYYLGNTFFVRSIGGSGL